MKDGITETELKRLGFRKVYEAEYRVRRSWFTEEEAQKWRRITPLTWSTRPSLMDIRDEAIALYRTSSRGRSVCLSEADAVRVLELKMEMSRRKYKAGIETADGRPTALRVTSHWEYFGDIEKQTMEAVTEMEVK